MQISSLQPYAYISVTEPLLQQGNSDKVTPFVTYLILGTDPRGYFNIRRRFREFLLLRNKLVERFIGIYIPPIPSKRSAVRKHQVEGRRKFLSYFCLKIAQRPFLFDSDIFQTFLRGDPDFERAAKLISKHQYALIANIYEVEFRAYSQTLDIASIQKQIQKQNECLKAVQKQLTIIREQIQQVADSKKIFIMKFAECYKIHLPRFQSQVLMAHGLKKEQFIFWNNQNFKQRLHEYLHFSTANPILDYVESITYDIREARALLQAIQSRKAFTSKKKNFESAFRQSTQELERLKSGRFSIKSVFKSGTKEDQIKQLEEYIPQYQQNESFVGTCLPLSAASIHRDIQQFKKSRPIDYLMTLQIVVGKEMKLLQLYGQMLIAAQVRHQSKQSIVVSEGVMSKRERMKEKDEESMQ